MNVADKIRVDWKRLHFCKEDKIKYRKHLTCGMLLATIVGMVGLAYGISWLSHASLVANAWTAIMWIWE